jgi:hypothetical protein
MLKSSTFFEKGPTLYLFFSGLVALFLVPFLTWFTYPVNFLLPSHVSLIFLFEFQVGRGASFLMLLGSPLILYLAGVGAAVIVAIVARRPVFFQGILPAIFPLWGLAVGAVQSIWLAPPDYFLHVLTIGMFTALLGSTLLEAAYFSYSNKTKSFSNKRIAGLSLTILGAAWLVLSLYAMWETLTTFAGLTSCPLGGCRSIFSYLGTWIVIGIGISLLAAGFSLILMSRSKGSTAREPLVRASVMR